MLSSVALCISFIKKIVKGNKQCHLHLYITYVAFRRFFVLHSSLAALTLSHFYIKKQAKTIHSGDIWWMSLCNMGFWCMFRVWMFVCMCVCVSVCLALIVLSLSVSISNAWWWKVKHWWLSIEWYNENQNCFSKYFHICIMYMISMVDDCQTWGLSRITRISISIYYNIIHDLSLLFASSFHLGILI